MYLVLFSCFFLFVFFKLKVAALVLYLDDDDVCVCVTGDSGNWIEIAYGTSSGAVRVIVQHPETVGSGPQLFQTFSVHRSPVTKIMLSEKHLISGTAVRAHMLFFCFPFNLIYIKMCSNIIISGYRI